MTAIPGFSRPHRVCAFTFCLLAGLAGTVSGQHLKQKLHSVKKETLRDLFVRQAPETCEDDCIEQLAKEIDWLEAYLDRYGSVVAKHPDVWGESRLTKFRNEYEQELSRRISCFEVRDNAAILRSDIAFLASATSLGLALEGGTTPNVVVSQSAVGTPQADEKAPDPSVVTAQLPAQTVSVDNSAPAGRLSEGADSRLEMTTELDQLSRYINHLHELRRINEGDDTSDSPGYSLNLVRIPVSINPGRDTRRGHGAEITITATPQISPTLLPETFRSLVINDLVDQLALPLMKLAEDPSLDFARFVQLFDREHHRTIATVKAVSRQIGAPGFTEIDQILAAAFGFPDVTSNIRAMENLVAEARDALQLHVATTVNSRQREDARRNIQRIDELAAAVRGSVLIQTMDLEARNYVMSTTSAGEMESVNRILGQTGSPVAMSLFSPNVALPPVDGGAVQIALASFRARLKDVEQLFNELFTFYEFETVSVNPITRRRSALPVAQVQLETIIGRFELVEIALEFRNAYEGRYIAWNGDPAAPRIHLADTRHFLQSNLRGAHDLLVLPQNRALIQELIEPGLTPEGLAAAVRSADQQLVEAVRARFAEMFQPGSRTTSIMAQLAWPVLIEMALLSDQLNRDVHDIAVTRGDCGCHPTEHHKYYLPMPHDHEAEQTDVEFQAATEAFQNYVRCRWPILVFQVDPVNEEQNVGESSVLARELAIASAVGLSSGRMNFIQANQFARQYREQIEAIGLNRTISGFAHSNDTFGWRFRPRIQTHKSQSTVRAFGETVFGRGPDANLREAALEPGMRECTAIVLMPSFVPYCDFDVRSNWFRLDNPRASDLSMHQSMQLSRSIRAMQDCSAQCIECAHLYRDGEPDRLLKRVHQLDRELPLQSMRAQIPYENTLGGFEMFSNGVTDLAPELVGWYGGPGIMIGGSRCPEGEKGSSLPSIAAQPPEDCHCKSLSSEVYGDGTTVFLVGDNFSVHETRIIAGGVELPREHVKLISRQVVQVTVPRCVETVVFDDPRDPRRQIPYVAIHAATPYGVTSHLHIPAKPKPAAPAAEQIAEIEARLNYFAKVLDGISWAWRPDSLLHVDYSFHDDGQGVYSFGCLGLDGNAPDLDFALGYQGNPTPLMLADLPVRVVGRLANDGGAVGEPFWLLGGKAQNDQFTISAEELLKSAEVQLRNLTLDQLGNEAVQQLSLYTHVVFAEGGNNATPARLLGEPNHVKNTIGFVLHRRTNPPANQRCTEPAPATGNSAPDVDPQHHPSAQPAQQGAASEPLPRFVPLPSEPLTRPAVDMPAAINRLRATPASVTR